ncbi:MAG TPA: hypothetical protein PKL84_13310, partial [Candidatus Hydrogenedentes bacterium]|nr:hypothetical protein [Candidatus Hydrogenedentota bacterium]
LWFVGQVLLIGLGFLLIRAFLRRAVETAEDEEAPRLETPKASPEELRMQEVTQEVGRMSRDEPETVSALLRTWMLEEED